jgi:hypothetical protein
MHSAAARLIVTAPLQGALSSAQSRSTASMVEASHVTGAACDEPGAGEAHPAKTRSP